MQKGLPNLLLMMLLRTFTAQLLLWLFRERPAPPIPGQGLETTEQFTEKIKRDYAVIRVTET